MKKAYEIICLNCKANRKIDIYDSVAGKRIDWRDNLPDENIVSGRERTDGFWGWQCICGNNSIDSEQEKRVIKNLAQPTPQELAEITQNLKPTNVKIKGKDVILENFIMREL